MKLFLSFIFLFTFHSEAARLCKSQRNLSYAEQLASLGPSFDLRLLKFDLFPSGNVFSEYEYDVSPAYTKGLYKRIDKWVVGSKLSSGNALDLKFGIDPQVQATFIRFKKDPCQAMLSVPYSPKIMPLKAQVAIGPDFKIGDYFLFRGSVGFSIGSDFLNLLWQSPWGVTLSGKYLIQGFYQLHIVRLDQTHIRLKILGHRGKSFSSSVGLGFKNDLVVFKIDQLNNELENLVNLNPIKLSRKNNNSDVFMVDYILDLTDSEVVSVFESMIRSAKDFKKIHLTGLLKRGIPLEDNLILDISGLEKLFRKDFQANSIGRIKRNLKTNSKQNSVSFNFDIGNKIIGHQSKIDRALSYMTVERPEEISDYYVLRSWDTVKNGHLFFDYNTSERQNSLRTLFDADKEFSIISPVNFVNQIIMKESRFTFSEFLNLKLMVKKLLPNEVFQTIPWNQWSQTAGQKFTNFGFRFNLMMSPDSINEAPELSQEMIKKLFREHMISKGLNESDYIKGQSVNDDKKISSSISFDTRLKHMASHLSILLDRKRPFEERLNLITKLQRNSLFTESGLSFIMSLKPLEMSRLYHLDLNISSNEAGIDYVFGDSDVGDLYKKLLSIKAALDDDAFDLLREAESLSKENFSTI
jgi:hypothetical protein